MKKIFATVLLFLTTVSCYAMPNKPGKLPIDFQDFSSAYNNFTRYPCNAQRVRLVGRNKDILLFDLHCLHVSDAITAFFLCYFIIKEF